MTNDGFEFLLVYPHLIASVHLGLCHKWVAEILQAEGCLGEVTNRRERAERNDLVGKSVAARGLAVVGRPGGLGIAPSGWKIS